MPIQSIPKQEVKKILGNLSDEEIDYKLNLAELGVERINENQIDLEITPNRPDLLSVHGLIRYLQSYFKKSHQPTYTTQKPESNYKVIIEKSVKKIRPYTACAIVKNLQFTEDKINEIIDIQEKLHSSYGRNRKKLAIGIYPLEKINLPITYLAKKPEEIKFQPLGFPKEINGRQILSQHSTGREYALLLNNQELFPIFQDASGEILSMPPIINSEKTGKITENTKEVFIECSGFNRGYLQKTLNIIVTALSDMGGRIYEMEIQDKTEGKYLSPNLEPEKLPFSPNTLNKTLGLELSEKQIKDHLEKMGITTDKDTALIPPYRTDILHEIDLAEEVAIAYGYNNFQPEIQQTSKSQDFDGIKKSLISCVSTIGQESSESILKRKLQEILIGLNLLEISTYHLSTKETQFKKIGIKEFLNQMIEVEDSKTENNILRNSLLSQSIKTLSENSDSSYPQKIFEIGRVFSHDDSKETQIKEQTNLCISLCHEKANFTEIKQILDYLARMLNLKYEIREDSHPSFIEGRIGSIYINNKKMGILGEISPTVLKNNKIKMPTSSLEMNIEKLKN